MSEYGSGLTFGQTRNMDKERIKHALCGELMCGEDENGFVYAKATPEECAAYILSAYDDCVYHAKQAMDSGRALERLMKSKGVEYTPEEYGVVMEAARLEFDDYQYENTDDDAPIGFDETPPEIDATKENGHFNFWERMADVEITTVGGNGVVSDVIIDGENVSDRIFGLSYKHEPGEFPKLTLTVIPRRVAIRSVASVQAHEADIGKLFPSIQTESLLYAKEEFAVEKAVNEAMREMAEKVKRAFKEIPAMFGSRKSGGE